MESWKNVNLISAKWKSATENCKKVIYLTINSAKNKQFSVFCKMCGSCKVYQKKNSVITNASIWHWLFNKRKIEIRKLIDVIWLNFRKTFWCPTRLFSSGSLSKKLYFGVICDHSYLPKWSNQKVQLLKYNCNVLKTGIGDVTTNWIRQIKHVLKSDDCRRNVDIMQVKEPKRLALIMAQWRCRRGVQTWHKSPLVSNNLLLKLLTSFTPFSTYAKCCWKACSYRFLACDGMWPILTLCLEMREDLEKKSCMYECASRIQFMALQM